MNENTKYWLSELETNECFLPVFYFIVAKIKESM